MKKHIFLSAVVLTSLILTSHVSIAQNIGNVVVSSALNTSSYSCADFTSTLSMGSHDDVKKTGVVNLQSFLQTFGYLHIDRATGYFGNLTKEAVQQFQKENNVPATGVVGPLTRAAIMKKGCSGDVNQNSAPVISSITPTHGPIGSVVKIKGIGFSTVNNEINFANTKDVKTGLASDGQTLRFVIPASPCAQGANCAQVVLANGSYPISVTNANGTSNQVSFNLTSEPLVIDDTFTIPLGKPYYVTDTFSIRATQVTADNRCPLGVFCIQFGNATIETYIKSNATSTTANLSVGPTPSSSSLMFDGYTVTLTQVDPIKKMDKTISPSEYMITYHVTRQ